MTTEEPEVDEPEQEQLADDVREALERIAKDDPDGLITTEAVVEAAQDPESPLHKYFEWDTDRAAHAYRLHQARQLVARCTLTVVNPGPRYVNIEVNKGTPSSRRGYVAVERAVADPDLYEQIVADAETAVIGWRNRLSAFERAHGVVEALDVAVTKMKSETKPKKAAA